MNGKTAFPTPCLIKLEIAPVAIITKLLPSPAKTFQRLYKFRHVCNFNSKMLIRTL